MSSSNPLIKKWEEIHGKKEEPKVIKAENAKIEFECEGTVTQVDEAFKKWASNTPVTSNLTTTSVATSNTGITKASPIKCFDNPSGNDAFLQIAEKVKNGTAQVTTVSIEVEHYAMLRYGKKITFEVYDYENP